MKLYCVFAVEYHIGKELIGIYESEELAVIRKLNYDDTFCDAIEIIEYELNVDIN